MFLLTTYSRLAMGWLSSRLIARVQVLGAGPGVPVHSRSLGRSLLTQMTFRTSGFCDLALHGDIAPGRCDRQELDSDLRKGYKVWGRRREKEGANDNIHTTLSLQ
jgi:hypothetical protein